MVVPKEICDRFSELEIIQKSLSEVDYFSCLYERYEARLMRYIKRLALVTDTEAEDILQESFISIWKNLHAFDQSLKLSSWIYRIVHNQALSAFRKKKSYGKDNKVAWDDSLNANLPDDTTLTDAGEMQNIDLSLHEVLEQLPLPYKEVLMLKFLENMGYEEISDVLKIPEGTVATRINRAKKAFKHLAEAQHISFEH
ncbi:MAG: RNA polymerase sigma factor [Saprospiraceae bacterium]|nr:RNA polymerase sigma factor [Saprospiraceae bacterium]MCF8252045.1 RNA polymerase sigma factor [Saprospiraceae bacterium]MCF8281734.1 RNA polymerase sigma factor [Bacteroidales bacterium]MCF8310378.1 RNA polymerase sigma factor [Saprospiraceae bacterium]MCF8439756.1 RNA polymerase sigma factor [Saprospiraceae bacterium]